MEIIYQSNGQQAVDQNDDCMCFSRTAHSLSLSPLHNPYDVRLTGMDFSGLCHPATTEDPS